MERTESRAVATCQRRTENASCSYRGCPVGRLENDSDVSRSGAVLSRGLLSQSKFLAEKNQKQRRTILTNPGRTISERTPSPSTTFSCVHRCEHRSGRHPRSGSLLHSCSQHHPGATNWTYLYRLSITTRVLRTKKSREAGSSSTRAVLTVSPTRTRPAHLGFVELLTRLSQYAGLPQRPGVPGSPGSSDRATLNPSAALR